MELATHLNQQIFDTNVEKVPNRNGYGEGLLAAGEKNHAVVALCGDLTESTRTNQFAEAFPERFVQVGVAEQNLASVASGMAAMGKIPFIASYAMFSPGRSWEQVRTTIAYNNANVKIVGAHAGLSVGPDGATHQAIEDLAIMRVMPNMSVVAPCDALEAKKVTLWAAEHQGPVYFRLAREKTPVVTTEDSPFVFGKGEIYMHPDSSVGTKVAIVSCGTILPEAMLAGRTLNQAGIGTAVVNMATIKPLDTELLQQLASEYELIVVHEEHQRIGGLGSAVCEYLAEWPAPPIMRIGVDDRFGQSGVMEELYAEYGIDADTVVSTVKTRLDR